MPLATFVVVAALGSSWWLTNGAGGLPSSIATALDALPGVDSVAVASGMPPTAEVVALADAAHLSDEGREIFYATQPELLDAEAFAGRCTDGHAASLFPRSEVVGCYSGGTGGIVLYAPTDPRLYGFVVETAAHEALHAAWDRLTGAEQDELEPLLEAEVATVAADDPILEQIAGSVGENAENRPTELFAYVGTLLWRDGGLAPGLEEVYGRFIEDRAALVAVHTAWQGALDDMSTEIEAAWAAAAPQETVNAQERAQLDADRASVAYYEESYDAKAAEVAAMSADQRSRLRLAWVWWDGTDLPMAAAAETLTSAAGLLSRDAANLSEREAALVAAEAAATAERARIEALVADLKALQDQLSPTPAAG
ncbi:hypothetical protein ATL42_2466 [Sanguibacter antarcticus]|uniref:Uncharacterized protein n=1 Tax=Sanguibacter antarcticus TaxID=372484 RepID=A0A2A9E8J4_9MICO|nr:hypothetical protein ATL42_2466 [Sanguibacter antarcticus]